MLIFERALCVLRFTLALCRSLYFLLGSGSDVLVLGQQRLRLQFLWRSARVLWW